MKICEIYESIQNGGKYVGYPMLFIKVSGCTRRCEFCDSEHHKQGQMKTNDQIIKEILKSKQRVVCWTGGEPLLFIDDIVDIYDQVRSQVIFHLETNGDLLEEVYPKMPSGMFHHIMCSPKSKEVAKAIYDKGLAKEINILTDLKTVGVDMIQYADSLTPLGTDSVKESQENAKAVWKYCVEHEFRFSPRLQKYIFFERKKGV